MVNDNVCVVVDTITSKNDIINDINSDNESIKYNVELIPINMHKEDEQVVEGTFSNKQGDSIVEDDDSKENYDMDEVEEDDEMKENQYNRDSLNGNANEDCNNNEDDGDGDDFDECDETQKLVLVTHNANNDLEDCDYYSDGDSANDEREEILKYNIGDGIIANLFVGLYNNYNINLFQLLCYYFFFYAM